MNIFINPTTRILQLESENARLRALVGERPAPEALEEPEIPGELVEQEPASTLVEQTSALNEAVSLIADIIL